MNKKKERTKKPNNCSYCHKKLTIGNSYNLNTNNICIDCAKKTNIKTVNPLEEKEITCPICGIDLTTDDLMITPTHLVCSGCFQKFKDQGLYIEHTRHTVHKKQSRATVFLVILIVILYVITSFPSFEKINPLVVQWGALMPTEVVFNHQYWRLITANLLHANPSHIFFNAVSILIWGHLLEKSIGMRLMILLMIFAGLLTTLTSMVFTPYIVSVGASGIAYGLMLAFIILASVRYSLYKPQMLKGQVVSAFVLIIIQIISNAFGPQTVDVFGHLGGSVAGIIFIVIYIFYHLLLKKELKY